MSRVLKAGQAAKIEEQKLRAIRLWMTGATYRQIAEQMNISVSATYRRVQAALDDMRPHADYDRYRAVQLSELEVARVGLRRVIAAFGARPNRGQPVYDLADFVSALGALLRLQEREAKLLGLDRAPTPVDELSSMSDEEMAVLMGEWADQLNA